jgi:hypothetical protein
MTVLDGCALRAAVLSSAVPGSAGSRPFGRVSERRGRVPEDIAGRWETRLTPERLR